MRSFTKLLRISLGISYKDHITVREAVRDKIRHAIGPCNDILTTIRNASLSGLGIVHLLIKISRACQDNFYTRNSARREKKRKTKEGLRE